MTAIPHANPTLGTSAGHRVHIKNIKAVELLGRSVGEGNQHAKATERSPHEGFGEAPSRCSSDGSARGGSLEGVLQFLLLAFGLVSSSSLILAARPVRPRR